MWRLGRAASEPKAGRSPCARPYPSRGQSGEASQRSVIFGGSPSPEPLRSLGSRGGQGRGVQGGGEAVAFDNVGAPCPGYKGEQLRKETISDEVHLEVRVASHAMPQPATNGLPAGVGAWEKPPAK